MIEMLDTTSDKAASRVETTNFFLLSCKSASTECQQRKIHHMPIRAQPHVKEADIITIAG